MKSPVCNKNCLYYVAVQFEISFKFLETLSNSCGKNLLINCILCLISLKFPFLTTNWNFSLSLNPLTSITSNGNWIQFAILNLASCHKLFWFLKLGLWWNTSDLTSQRESVLKVWTSFEKLTLLYVYCPTWWHFEHTFYQLVLRDSHKTLIIIFSGFAIPEKSYDESAFFRKTNYGVR